MFITFDIIDTERQSDTTGSFGDKYYQEILNKQSNRDIKQDKRYVLNDTRRDPDAKKDIYNNNNKKTKYS